MQLAKTSLLSPPSGMTPDSKPAYFGQFPLTIFSLAFPWHWSIPWYFQVSQTGGHCASTTILNQCSWQRHRCCHLPQEWHQTLNQHIFLQASVSFEFFHHSPVLCVCVLNWVGYQSVFEHILICCIISYLKQTFSLKRSFKYHYYFQWKQASRSFNNMTALFGNEVLFWWSMLPCEQFAAWQTMIFVHINHLDITPLPRPVTHIHDLATLAGFWVTAIT